MDWYTYEIPPIDFGWEHLRTVKETVSDLAAESSPWEEDYPDVDSSAIRGFLSAWESAKDAAREIGWEGDFCSGPVVMWILVETGFCYGFVFKQLNNGTTYAISPVALPWLERL